MKPIHIVAKNFEKFHLNLKPSKFFFQSHIFLPEQLLTQYVARRMKDKEQIFLKKFGI